MMCLMVREREASGLEAGPTKHQAALFVNMKGCGYPPTVNCANWTRSLYSLSCLSNLMLVDSRVFCLSNKSYFRVFGLYLHYLISGCLECPEPLSRATTLVETRFFQKPPLLSWFAFSPFSLRPCSWSFSWIIWLFVPVCGHNPPQPIHTWDAAYDPACGTFPASTLYNLSPTSLWPSPTSTLPKTCETFCLQLWWDNCSIRYKFPSLPQKD